MCFDGYDDSSNSTKFAEQCRCTTGKHVAPDILFELQMPVTFSQTVFLGNHNTISRFSALIASLTHSDIKCPQSQADAYFLICNSAIELAEESDCPVILVGKDTDLLVMSIDRSCQNLYMQYSNNTIYSTDSIRDALPSNVRYYLLVAHAITGCDIVI